MPQFKVVKIRSRRHLLFCVVRLEDLNRLRLVRLLSEQEEENRKALDRGIQFYVLARLRGRQGFTSYRELLDFLLDLKNIFSTYGAFETTDGHSVIRQLVEMGFTLRLEYEPSNAVIFPDSKNKSGGE